LIDSRRIRHGVRSVAERVLPSSLVVWRGRRDRRRIALSFDDGPCELTRDYLAVLERYRARATFFLVGEACASQPELVHAIAARGHELAGHGYTHRRFPTLSAAELEDELLRTQALLPPRSEGRLLVRPPHGAVSLSTIFVCARMGFTTALWSDDSGDWCTQSAADVRSADWRPGAIVLMHEGQTWTLEALPRILGKLRQEGHELVTVGELLDG
jgi:peptidoglycan/xylan/chitin deacetylase (PgdA/CDA1 family)